MEYIVFIVHNKPVLFVKNNKNITTNVYRKLEKLAKKIDNTHILSSILRIESRLIDKKELIKML